MGVRRKPRLLIQTPWPWMPWRWVLLIGVFTCGLSAFFLGVGVTARPGVPDASLFTKVYYALGLFVLGGLDLGVPIGGPAGARGMLWFAYFAAPTITASAVIEGLLRAIRPRSWALERLVDHIVIAGAGKIAMEYLARLRAADPHRPVVLVDIQADRPNLDEARALYDAYVVIGDISSDLMLRGLRLDHARRVLLLTGDDFVNLDTAAKITHLAPRLAGRIIAHVSDLHFARVVEDMHVADDVMIFNTHQIAAEHLVKTKLLQHFQRTDPLDTVVIAGFGRFGQTVLDELQKHAAGKFDRVALVDLECTRRALLFEDQVGFEGDYRRDLVNGDLRDPALWLQLASDCSFGDVAPAFVIGSGDDGVNLHTALWLKSKYPHAYVVARSFRSSAFAEDVSRKAGMDVFSVAELVSQSIPDMWVG